MVIREGMRGEGDNEKGRFRLVVGNDGIIYLHVNIIGAAICCS